MAGLHFDITGDNSNFMRKLEETQRGIRNTSRLVEQEGGSIEALFGRMTKAATAFAAGFSAKEIGENIIKIRGEFQQLEVAFTTMLGSSEKASALMSQLTATAAKTPFDLQGVANGARQLLAYGTAAEDVNETLVRLGNIAAGLSIPLNDLVYLYGTSMTQGRLYTQDLNQFTGRGIPMIKELAKEFGVAETEIKSMVEAGKVGFPEVQKVIQNLTNEGGMFFNLMQEQSKTITGQISNIGDSFSMMFNEIGKSSEGVINNALAGVSYLIENYEEIGKQVLELVSAYGAYKAILITVSAYQKASANFQYAQEAEELSKLLPVKQTSINQDIEAAVASGRLGQAKAEELIAIRAEVQSKIQAAQATKVQADAEYASAAASYKAALQRNIVAKQNMALAQSQMQIAIQSGSVTEIETARKNAQTASLELNNAAIAKNTAHKNLAVAASAKKAATESLETLQIGANTAAQVANTRTTNILTIAKTRLAAASKALGVSMLANPYVLAAAAVATLGYGIYKLITYQTEAEKAQERLNDAVRESDKMFASERLQIDEMFGRLKAAKEGTDEYRAAKEAIMNRYGEYLKSLGDEKTALNDIARAYELITDAAKNSARERAMNTYIEEAGNTLAEREAEIKEQVRNLLNDKFGDSVGEDGVSLAETYYWKIVPVLEGGEEMTDEVRGIVKQFDKLSFSAGGFGVPSKVDKTNPLSDWINQAAIAQENYNRAVAEAKSNYWSMPGSEQSKEDVFSVEGKSISQIEEEIGHAQEKLKSLKDDFAKGTVTQEAVAQQEAYIKSLQNTVLEREKDLKVISEVEARISALKKAQKETVYGSSDYNSLQSRIDALSNKLPGTKSGQTESQKQLDNQQKLSEELLSLRRKNQQDEINLMEEGTEKKIAQINLDYEKERDAIKKQAEKWAQGQGGILTTEQTILISASYSNAQKRKDNKIADVNEEQVKAARQAMDEYLKEYGNYQEKRLAITEEYNRRIAEASTAGESLSLKKELENSLKELDFNEFKNSIDFSDVFGNLDEQTTSALESLRDKLSEYINQAAKDLRPEDLKELQDAFSNIEFEITDRKPFDGLKNGLDEYRSSQEQVRKAQEDLNTVMSGGEVIVGLYTDENGKLQKKLLTTEQAEKKVTEAQKKRQESLEKITQSANSIGAQGMEVVNAGGEIMDMLESFGVKLPEAVSQTLDGWGQALSGLASMDLARPFSVVTGAVSVISGYGKIIASWFGGKKKVISEETFQEYDRLTSAIDNLINKQKELIETTDTVSGEIAAREAEKLAKKQQEASQNLLYDYLNSYDGSKHTVGYNIQKWFGDYRDEIEEAGLDFDKIWGDGRVTGLSTLSASEIEALQSIPELWAKLPEKVSGFLEDVVAAEDSIKETGEALEESLAGVSFDSFKDSYRSILKDLDADNEDLANNLEDYLKDAMIDSLIDDVYNDELKKLYDKFVQYRKSDSDKGSDISEDELEALRRDKEKLANQMMADRDALAELYGWESDAAKEQNQTQGQASSRGFGSEMTHEDAGELSGRFAALQETGASIETQNALQTGLLQMLNVGVTSQNNSLIEIRNLIITSNEHLETISGYNKKIFEKLDSRLDEINNSLKK